MISRLRLVSRIGGASRLLALAKPSVPATTRLMCQVTPKEEETPEFGQFFRDVSSMLKEKTGETGHKLLAGGLLTYMLSKELLILHDETLLGVVMAATVYALYLRISQPITDMLDDRSQEILDLYNEGRNSQIEVLTKAIEEEKKIEYMLTARKDIVEVMRENNAMSLEVEYRNRLHEVVREVKKRLDYQAEMEAFQRKTEQDHIIDWVEQEVVKSITPQLEKDSVSQCIKDLKAMTPA
ncbi:ATP synthase F(0) complex subunit B1, mitochondrial-like [Orbicella faveolata]|uniref:ATP synthase F(0) complex subunit B1, mitochondrial-like n=1 Tax=Orbicella faveolata TaxID=48498 RepID=UPI0009E2047F|nr:ATP synthase F(0) complex subunit B1, mitochondrial-like [Orbicella faveolata]